MKISVKEVTKTIRVCDLPIGTLFRYFNCDTVYLRTATAIVNLGQGLVYIDGAYANELCCVFPKGTEITLTV